MSEPRYCLDCHSRYFDTGKKASGHIPFRDRASQSSMRRPADKEAVLSQDEPEEEPIVETQPDSGEAALPELPLLDEDEDEEDARDDAGDPLADEESPDPVDTKWPTLDEYKVKWASLLEAHSRPNAGGFSRNNLVPEPITQLWQDCPTGDGRRFAVRAWGRPDVPACSHPGGISFVSRYVPFDALKSDDAMSRLSRCRPVSGFRPSHCEDGIIRFAHNTGDSWWLKLFSRCVCLTFGVALSTAKKGVLYRQEVNFRRRGPMQLASTLGFILNKRSGKFLGLTPEEQAALHECLTWWPLGALSLNKTWVRG